MANEKKKLKVDYRYGFLTVFILSVSAILILISGFTIADKIAMSIIVGIIVTSFIASMFGEKPEIVPMEEGVFFGTLDREEFLGRPVAADVVNVAGKNLYMMDFESYDEKTKSTVKKRVVFLYGSPDRTDLLVPIMQDGRVVRRVLRGFRLDVTEAAEKLLIGKSDPWLVHTEEENNIDISDVERELKEKCFDEEVSEVIFYAPYAPNDVVKEFLKNGLKTLSDMNFKITDERIRTIKILEKAFDEFRSEMSKALETIIPLAWKIADSYVDGLDLAALIITRGVSGLEALKLEQIANMRDIDTQISALVKIRENLKKYRELIPSIETGETTQVGNIRDEIYELRRQIASLASKIEGVPSVKEKVSEAVK